MFGDGAETYLQVGAEVIAAQEVDIFTTVDYENPDAMTDEAKLEFLQTTFPNALAAQNERYVSVSAPAFAAGVRIPDAVETLARAFHPEAFGE